MKLKISLKGKKSSKNLQIQATGINMTSQAGLVPMFKFLERYNFSSTVREHCNITRGANAVYGFDDMLECCITGILAGARSLDGITEVWKDEALMQMLGWDSIPHRTVIQRLFASLTMKDVAGLETVVHAIRKKIWEKSFLVNRSSSEAIIIDVDSTVKGCFGNQQGSEKGYNPHKRGGNSHHPQLAFCAETKEILQGWYRCGSAYTSNGIVEFMKQLIAQLPTSEQFFFRADSGYFCGDLLDSLEEDNFGYLIKVKMKNLTSILEQQQWTAIAGKPGWEEAVFVYKCSSWSKERTFKAVRQECEEGQTEEFLLEVKRYSYFCYVTTDEKLSPYKVHKKYGQRATCETWIEEAKNQVAVAHIKCHNFEASSILFQCSIIAYNIFRHMGLVSSNANLQKWEPATIRTYLIRTAGKLLTGSRQLKLVTPKKHFHQNEWDDWIKTGGLRSIA